MQSWCRTWPPNGSSRIRAKQKLSQETQWSLQKFLEPNRKPEVIYTDNSLEFAKACEDLSWNHCTSTPHRSETSGIAERAVCRVKEGTSSVLLQSGLGRYHGMFSYLRNVQVLLSDRKHHVRETFWRTFKRTDHSVWSTHWVLPWERRLRMEESSFGRTITGKAIWRNPIAARLGESFQLGKLLRTSWKRTVLICVCGWHKTGWKETKSWSDVESTQQRSWFGRTNIFPGSCLLGMHSMTMPKKQRYCGQLQNHVWITNFRRRNWQPSYSENFRISWSRHGGPCQEMCGTILWVSKHDDSTTLQSICSMHRWPPLQRRRNEICWRFFTSMLSNCFEMLFLGTFWKTWYSMVSKQICTIDYEMDQSLWQTLESNYILHSSDMCI